jgi:hypothetical protein
LADSTSAFEKLPMIDVGRRAFIVGGSLLAGGVEFLSTTARAAADPRAVSGAGWSRKSNWNFGSNPGNNIGRLTEWLRAGWTMSDSTFLNDECETYNNRDLTDANLNFQAFPDHCDIVAIWNGGTVASGRGNGSISSLALKYDVPFPNAIGYYELTCKISSVSGAWPAWWTIGHRPNSQSSTWGPEIDIFEFYDNKTRDYVSTLHGSRPQSYCFLKTGGKPPGLPETAHAIYDGSQAWDMGHFTYTPGFDFAEAYHRFGAMIDRNYRITLWVDDLKVGTFAANQYCDDDGHPVAAQLIVNLALGTHNPDPAASIHTADFGGVNARSAANKFRLSLKNIQIWGP